MAANNAQNNIINSVNQTSATIVPMQTNQIMSNNTITMNVPALTQLTTTPSAVVTNATPMQIPLAVQNPIITNNTQVHQVITGTPTMTAGPTLVATSITSSSSPSINKQTPSTSQVNSGSNQANAAYPTESTLVSRSKLLDLVREVDPSEQLDEDVEELLLTLADEFVETTVNSACLLAKHRKVNNLEIKDIQLHLERRWNMWTPGFGTDELKPYKRAPVTEAHKQRLALIRKVIKKY